MTETARILKLSARNFKRLRAVEITPGPDGVILTGKNGAGKSSCLDAIWAALGSKAASPPDPIRHGEEEAEVELDLGEIKVRRRWKAGRSDLLVTDKNGAYAAPQKLLDGLVGSIAFDPLAFTRSTPKEQIAQMLRLVDLGGLDLEALARTRAERYSKRTEKGRQRDRSKGAAEAIVIPEGPAELRSIADISAAAQKAGEEHRKRKDWEAKDQRMTENLADLVAERDKLSGQIKDLGVQCAEHKSASPPVVADSFLAESARAITEAEAHNEKHRARAAAERAKDLHKAEADARAKEYRALTKEIEAIDSKKTGALAAAKFPVDGMGFDDEGRGITFGGVLLEQCGEAERIRVSTAVAMATNPRLQVVAIRDASLLDEESMQAVWDLTKARGYQLFLEVVDSDDPAAVLIEDGMVVEAGAST